MKTLTKSKLVQKLDALPKLNWDDFDYTSKLTQDLVRELIADKETLRSLVYNVEHSPELLANSECHELLERIELYDGSDRNFRLRFNFSTEVSSVRPHDHRYSFTTYIARGSYNHIWFKPNQMIYDESKDEAARKYIDKFNPDTDAEVDTYKMDPLFIADENEGACYTIHHSTIHATITTPETVSLFFRGPAEKRRSLIADRETNKIWWRYGREDEHDKRVVTKKMSLERYFELRGKLEEWNII
jgi:hypothetical protein